MYLWAKLTNPSGDISVYHVSQICRHVVDGDREVGILGTTIRMATRLISQEEKEIDTDVESEPVGLIENPPEITDGWKKDREISDRPLADFPR